MKSPELNETKVDYYYDYDFEAIKDKPAGVSCPEYSEDIMDQDPKNDCCALMRPV